MGAPFSALVAQLGSLQSASVLGPDDNAHAESFLHSLKAELIRRTTFATESELHRHLKPYIRYYNAIRLPLSLNYLSPIAFERGAA